MTVVDSSTDATDRHAGASGYFDIAREHFALAERSATVVTEDFRIAGLRIRLRCAGTALHDFITTALAHLRVEPGDGPELTVGLWDAQETGVTMPAAPWPDDKRRARGETAFFNAGSIHVYYQIDAGVLGVVDTRRGEAFVQVASAAAVPYYEQSHPLRTILHVWLATRERQLVHAGAVGTSVGAVMLAGMSGCGKSTATLACLRAGMLYLGDDYTVAWDGARPHVASLYSIAKLNPDNLARFPELKPLNAARLASQKALVPLHPQFAAQLAPVLPLRAILLPWVSGVKNSRLTSTTASQLLRAMAPSTVLQLPGAGQSALRALGELVTRVPCFILESGSDLATIPAAIQEILIETGS
ncbi:MAG: hypothetical protein AB1705_09770 [Verrucomicrobiota bacterium]